MNRIDKVPDLSELSVLLTKLVETTKKKTNVSIHILISSMKGKKGYCDREKHGALLSVWCSGKIFLRRHLSGHLIDKK